MGTPLGTTLTNKSNVVVVLERDPAIEALSSVLAKTAENLEKSQCVLCGGHNLHYPEGRARRRYGEQTDLLKKLLMTPEVRKKMSPKVYNQFSESAGSCVDCLEVIKEVWDLHQEMNSIQQEVNQLVAKARDSVISRCGGLSKLRMDATNTQQKRTDPEPTELGETLENPTPEPVRAEPFADNMNQENPHNADDGVGEGVGTGVNTGVKVKTESENKGVNGGRGKRYQKSLSQKWTPLCPLKMDKDTTDSDESSTEDSSSSDHEREDSNSDDEKEENSIVENMANPLDIKTRKHLKCSKCGKTFATFKYLINHEVMQCKIRHDENELKRRGFKFQKCDHCNEIFRGTFFLRHTINNPAHFSKTKTRPFQCHGCFRSFSFKNNRDRHCSKYCTGDGKCLRYNPCKWKNRAP